MRSLLEKIAERCRLGQELEPAERVVVAMALGGWLAGSFPTLDEAFGVKRRPGQRSNRKMAIEAARDLLIQRCAIDCYSGADNPAAALLRDANRYQAGGWRVDRRKTSMPSGYAGTPRGFFFEILQGGCSLPNSEKQIRRILQRDNRDTKWVDFMSLKAG